MEEKKKEKKRKGTLLEMRFAAECIERGAVVSQPFGDYAPYDLLVDVKVKIYRVQVKSASPNGSGKYLVNLTKKAPNTRKGAGPSSRSVRYEPGEIDYIVTNAGGVWFFFDNPHELTGNENVYPDRIIGNYKGNRGREKWEWIGLGPKPIPDTSMVEVTPVEPTSECIAEPEQQLDL
jgi:hypothetical protein